MASGTKCRPSKHAIIQRRSDLTVRARQTIEPGDHDNVAGLGIFEHAL
jgi:hypothetical protein